MRILGIDPGTAITGYGIIEAEAGRVQVQDYGCIRTAADQPLPGRLASLYEQVIQLLRDHQPDWVAVEELFFNKNVRTALAVGQARGVVLLAVTHRKLPLAEYTPLQVKQAITGYGRAPKEQMQRMVQLILKLPEPPSPDDVADALAIAVCHATFHSFREKAEGAVRF